MGSDSDLPVMQGAVDVLTDFGVAHEVRVVSAHRTPDVMYDYARTAADRGLRVIIAGAGGAAHLPGMTASMTSLPVIGVPVPLQHLDGLDSLLSIVQMPDGIPVATVGVGKARNAGLLAVRILGAHDDALRAKLDDHRAALDATVRAKDAALSKDGLQSSAPQGLKSGLRFSLNAATPSIPSDVPDAAEIASASRARWVSSVSSRRCAGAASPPPARAADPRPAWSRALAAASWSSSSGTTCVIRPQSSASAALQHPVGERELQRAAQPDQSGQEPARRAVGGEPDAGVGHHELRRLRGHDEVGGTDEAHAGPGRAPLHRGHDRRVAPHQVGDRDVERTRGSRGGGWGGRRGRRSP